MFINWKARVKNKYFWITLIPAILILIQTVLNIFGVSYDFGVLSDNLISAVNALFVVLTIIGVVNDPTTKGIKDSDLAMTYEKPKE